MECNKIENYLKENECCDNAMPEELKKHLVDCNDCRHYYQFVSVLDACNDSMEKAPEDLLTSVEKEIIKRNPYKKREPFALIHSLFKPAFAVSFVLVAAIFSYVFLTNKNIGHVENLSKRFKIAQFENIKSGDVLYAGDQTIATIMLTSKNKLQMRQNTIVRVKDARQLSLSRGEVSLLSGDKEVRIETPDGLILARNANIKITTVARVEKGLLKTETTCAVFSGKLTIKYSSKEIILNQGQKAVLAENGGITYRQLTAADSQSEKSDTPQQKLLAAVESLCECINAENYAPGKKSDHLQLFGKEVNENKFKVRVFWREKALNGLVLGPLNEINKI